MSQRVSVIIPCFNQAQFVGQAIKSCLEQTDVDVEILAVDDASTDGSAAEIRSLARDARVKPLFLDVNSGAPRARNHGLERASGEYIFFLDGDDFFDGPHVLRRLIDAIGDADFIYGDRRDLNDRTGEIRAHSQSPPRDLDDPLLAIISQSPITSTVLFRRRLFENQRWDPLDSICQEFHLIVSIVLAGAHYRHLPFSVAMVREHNTPSRISNQGINPSEKLGLLLMEFEARLKADGRWNIERRRYFNQAYMLFSMRLAISGSSPAQRELSRTLWKRVDRLLLLQYHRYSIRSWLGVAVLITPRHAAALRKLIKRLLGI